MNRKAVFFTSDWHIGHDVSIKFDNRPFKNIDHMHETLIKRYNAMVGNSGICYFLGDMGNKTETIRNVMKRLNGTKVLLWGNHDKGISTMYNCGFDVVLNSATLYINKQRVTMSHCPLPNIRREDTTLMKGHIEGENWHGESRKKHQQCITPDNGQFHLHGHIHSPNGGLSKKIQGKQYDVGVVANKYAPVTYSRIESWIAKYE